MNKFLNFGLFFLALVFIAAVSAHASPKSDWENLVTRAQKEGKVVIYGSVIGETAGELSKVFKKRYGIALELVQGRGSEVITKLFAERRTGLYIADVGIGSPTPFFNMIEPENIVVPLEPLLALEEVKDPTKWLVGKVPFLEEKKALVALVASRTPVILLNTTMVKENEFASYDDLLAPKWKGKIVINDPAILGMGNEWFSFMMLQSSYYGKEKGARFMKQLALQKPILSRDSRLQVEWVAKGKYPIGLAFKPTIVTAFINAGAPLKFVAMLKEGVPITSGSLNLHAYDKAPHPNATKLFVNWVLTKEAGEIIARTSGYSSARVDVSKEGFDPSSLPGPNDALGGRDYHLTKGPMLKASAEIFKDVSK